MSAIRPTFSILLILLLAAPAAAQSTRGRQQCQACTAPVARLGFRFQSEWNEAEDEVQRWSETLTVVEVLADTPADDGGLEAGDVILRVNELVATSQLFWSIRRTLQPGDTLRFRIERDGSERELRLVAVGEEGS
jgi:S1-C subfamily serine protease